MYDTHRDRGTLPWLAIGIGVAAGVTVAALLARQRQQEHDWIDDAPPTAHRRARLNGMPVVARSVTINRPRSELYRRWRDFARLPEFMDNVKAVRPEGPDGHVWTIAAPMGRTIEVATRITEDVADERVAWASTEESAIRTEGAVTFRDAPPGRGTVVEAVIAYEPPAGELGRLVAALFRREPGAQGRHELKRFKMLMETGEVATNHNRND